MEKNSKQHTFEELRKAYMEVKAFLEEESLEDVTALHLRITTDLGMLGKDNRDMINRFAAKYGLSKKGFKYKKYFLTENELFGVQSWMVTILTLPLEIIDLISILVFNSGKRLVPDMHREVQDLTFGDMLTWYLNGEFKERFNYEDFYKARARVRSKRLL